jgi:hypothetical protein
MVLQGEETQVEVHFIHLEIVLAWCKIGALFFTECTIGMEIVLDNTMELLRDVGHNKSQFGLFRDGASVSAR